jgi:hypothetical protein
MADALAALIVPPDIEPVIRRLRQQVTALEQRVASLKHLERDVQRLRGDVDEISSHHSWHHRRYGNPFHPERWDLDHPHEAKAPP